MTDRLVSPHKFMGIEKGKLTRIEALKGHRDFWFDRKVAAEIDLASAQRVSLVGVNPTENLANKMRTAEKIQKAIDGAEKYVGIIEHLIKQENGK